MLALCATAACERVAPLAPGDAPAGGSALPSVASKAPTLLFDSEFSGSSLDTSVWYTCYPSAKPGAGCTNNPSLELEWYTAANVTVGGGVARLTAREQNAHAKLPFTSGMISTGGTPSRKATFSFLYGYAEARMKLPRGAGMWPAFWLIPADRTWPPEIDIMEWQGVAPRNDLVHVHYGNWHHPQSLGTAIDTGVDLWNGFHTYAVDWEPSNVTWYFDGKPVYGVTDPAAIAHKPMYVILNLAIGGWLNGQLKPSPKDFPATMAVDYVRVWSAKP